MTAITWRSSLLRYAVGLYFLLALGLLAPMASNTVLPAALDHANHTAFVVQAKMALDEGQFPLRIAPFQHERLRYPVFQFYSSTPYLIGGLIYKYITPWNPWLALKIVYALGLCIAGFFVFRIGEVLGFDETISILMGVVYITAPYVLINVLTRGAYTEAFAQFLLPIIGYASLRLFIRPTRFRYVWATVAWLLLGTSHVITFIYGTFFYLILVLALFLFRSIDLKMSTALVVASGLGWLVSAFQWYPAATIGHLQIHSLFGNVFDAAWLTPISTLLATTSSPPEPLGRDVSPFLTPSLGLPTLIAVVGLIYFRRRLGADASRVWPIMLVFGLAFICAWSPFDFWSMVPNTFKVVQFPYRFLTFTVALGCALFGYFATIYGRHYGSPSFLGWLICLILFTNSYLPSFQRNTRTLGSIIAAPDLGYGAGAYLYTGESSTNENYRDKYETRLPLASTDDWLRVGEEMPLDRAYIEKTNAAFVLKGNAEPLRDSCQRLDLTLDGDVIASRAVGPGPFEWLVPNAPFRHFRDSVGKLAFQSKCGFVPAAIDPVSKDTRLLWIRVESLQFRSGAGATLALEETRPHCKLAGARTDCELDTPTALEAQLPVLYYPSLLRITVNGKAISYRPSTHGAYILAIVSLPPGQNRVVIDFSGSRIGNLLSLFGIAAVLIVTYLNRSPSVITEGR